MFGLRPTEIVIILVLFMLLFGAKRLPELGRGLGSAMRDFRKGISGDERESGPAKKKLSA